jgi:hypothetical protein
MLPKISQTFLWLKPRIPAPHKLPFSLKVFEHSNSSLPNFPTFFFTKNVKNGLRKMPEALQVHDFGNSCGQKEERDVLWLSSRILQEWR